MRIECLSASLARGRRVLSALTQSSDVLNMSIGVSAIADAVLLCVAPA